MTLRRGLPGLALLLLLVPGVVARFGVTVGVTVAAMVAASGDARADDRADDGNRDASPLDEADRRAFAWFDGIGLPSTKGLRFVRVTQTRKPDPKRPAEGAPESWETYGFLLSEDDAAWTLLRGDLWTERIERHATWCESRLDPVDLRGVASAAIARLGRRDGSLDNLQDRLVRGMSVHLGEHAEALALARHCAENGLEREAKDLLDAARKLPRFRDAAAVEGPIERIAADQMAESVLWKITLDFGGSAVPRPKLLERLRAWQRSFPGTEHAPKADEAVRVLERMAVEDAAHAPVSDAEFATLPPDAQVRELIWRLRDQPGEQFSQPGSPSVFVHFGEHADDTPADRLLALGDAAIPALIEALTDDRFTRCVGFWRDFCFSHYVVRVGDAALDILERITKQRFWQGTYTAASMVKDSEQQAVQAKVRRWWIEVSGFVTPLRALAAAEDDDARRAAVRALPDRGPGPIAGAADAVWGTGSFVKAIPDVSDARARTILRCLVADAPKPRTRALAAWALLDLGERTVAADVAALWRSLDDAVRGDPEQGGAVASFLASCGDADATRALGEGLDERPVAVREVVLLAFQRGALGPVRGLAAGADGGIATKWYEPGAASDAAEDVISSRLGDTAEDALDRIPRQTPICNMVPDYDCGRRLADLAVRVLSDRLPAAYPLENAPVRSKTEWEDARVRFTAIASKRREERAK